MVEDGVEISDDSDSTTKEVLSIKEIILRQIRKIADISCKEFTGGYWVKKPVKTGSGVMFSEVYHPDVREAYCNSVDFLIDIIYPLADDDLQKYLQSYEGFKAKIYRYTRKKKDGEEEIEEDKKEDKPDPDIEIKEKLKLKRQSFRQINIMFERNNFWKGSGSYNE